MSKTIKAKILKIDFYLKELQKGRIIKMESKLKDKIKKMNQQTL